MFTRWISVVTSALLMSWATIVLPPAANAIPEAPPHTGYVQVINEGQVVGCLAAEVSNFVPITLSSSSAAYMSIRPGTSQELSFVDDPSNVYGINTIYMTTAPRYALLTKATTDPRFESAVWEIDETTLELTARPAGQSGEFVGLAQGLSSPGSSVLGTTAELSAVQSTFTGIDRVTYRLGEHCGDQPITFTSTAPTEAVPGDTYTAAATGGGSGNPVTFSSTTTTVCSLDGSTVTFDAPGTCTIAADQAAGDGFRAAQRVTQSITVSQHVTSTTLVLDTDETVFGQVTTATVTVAADTGTLTAAGGSVQFAVDGTDIGSPVAIDGAGHATSPEFTAPVGTRPVTARYTPAHAHYTGSTGTASLTVSPADTTTSVAVSGSALTATVEAVAPGAGTPEGEVAFHVDGALVGTASLTDGAASLAYVVPADKDRTVSATYAGSTQFNASSASTARTNPKISAKVRSAKTGKRGWSRGPVTVSFTCTSAARLVTACPKPVTLKKQGANSVSRTIHTTDGGVATVTASAKIDSRAPSLRIKGVKANRSYFDAPKPKCSTKDATSGIQKCKVTKKRKGKKVVVTAKATDKAGNVTTKRVKYRVADHAIRGAKQVNGVWRVKHGKTYTIVVRGAKPRYVYASPTRPHHGSVPFTKIGKNTWALGVTMSMATSHTRNWKLGYVQKGKLHTIKVKVTG